MRHTDKQRILRILEREEVMDTLQDIIYRFTYASDLAGITSLETWIEERAEDLIGEITKNCSESEKQKIYQRYYNRCKECEERLHEMFSDQVFDELYKIIIG